VSPTTTEERQLVDEVVDVLTGPPVEGESAALSLKEQLQRAADEYDRRAAAMIGKALVDSLCEDPADARRLEALLILGLAHPSILERYQISLAAEGRRLCVLLENQGELDRARGLLELLALELPEDRQVQQDLSSFMRRSGEVDELVERCLRHAEENVNKGKLGEAISWLQEVLLHDQSRRDVARMIRDLRYKELADRKASRRRNRVILLLVVITSALTALGLREGKIRQEYASLPPLEGDDSAALDSRLESIDRLIASNRFWLGMFSVVDERSDLQQRMVELGAEEADQRRAEIELAYQRETKAESLRLKAIDSVAAGKLNVAHEQFTRALDCAPADWDRRKRIEANLQAIEKLLDERQ